MNTPNKLSILRIILVPLMMVAFMWSFPYHMFVALAIFIISAFTDFLDGHIARKYNQVTDLGKFLDPIADKMLTTTALLLLVGYNIIPNPYGIICLFLFISRDLIVDALRQIAASKGRVISAISLGKYKTFAVDVAIPVLMIFQALVELGITGLASTIIMWIGFALLIFASVLNIISCIVYIVKNIHLLKQ